MCEKSVENMSSTVSEADGEDDSGRHFEDVENLRKLLMSGGVDIQVESIDFFAGSSSGDNYMSVVKRVLVKGRDQAENGKCPWFQSCAYSILFCVFSILSLCVSCCSKSARLRTFHSLKVLMCTRKTCAHWTILYSPLAMAMLLFFTIFRFFFCFQCLYFDRWLGDAYGAVLFTFYELLFGAFGFGFVYQCLTS